MFVAGEHDGHRALDVRKPGIQQPPTDAGGVHHVAVADQDERVDPFVIHRVAQPGPAFAVHPRRVGEFGNLDGGAVHREGRHWTPRKFLMLALTIFVASSGPTASTTLFSDFSEYPNVDSLCGESDAHITLSTPILSISSRPSGSTMKEAHMWSLQ